MTPHANAAGDPGSPSPDGPLYRPVVDLDSGAVLAVEAELPASSPTPTINDPGAQADRLGRLARLVTEQESLLPLVLPLPAMTLAGGPDVFRLVDRELRRAGRRPRDVTLMLGPELRDLPRATLIRGVARLRELGFRCAFGTSAVPPDLLVEADPFLFRIDPGIVAGVDTDDRRLALVDGLIRIVRGSGVYPMAAGVSSVAQLVRLRGLGVRMANGPLFAGEGWLPGAPVEAVPESSIGPEIPGDEGPRVAEFMTPPVAMTSEATAEEVLEAFTNDTALNSVVLIDHRDRPIALIDRTRFLLAVTGPYGHALHAKRPAERLADPPRTVALGLPAMAALRAAGAERERVYDDLITVNEFGQCAGIVHVGDLIRSLAKS